MQMMSFLMDGLEYTFIFWWRVALVVLAWKILVELRRFNEFAEDLVDDLSDNFRGE